MYDDLIYSDEGYVHARLDMPWPKHRVLQKCSEEVAADIEIRMVGEASWWLATRNKCTNNIFQVDLTTWNSLHQPSLRVVETYHSEIGGKNAVNFIDQVFAWREKIMSCIIRGIFSVVNFKGSAAKMYRKDFNFHL